MCRMPPRLAGHGSAAQVVSCFGYCVLISYQLGTWSTLQNSSRTVCSRSREVASKDGASGLATNFRTSSRPGAMRFGAGRDVRSRGPCFRWPRPAPAGSLRRCLSRRSAGARRSSRPPSAELPPQRCRYHPLQGRCCRRGTSARSSGGTPTAMGSTPGGSGA